MVSEPWSWNTRYFVGKASHRSFFAIKKKSEKNTIVFQFEGTFYPGIILTKSNYDVWSQLVEMHIAEQEKLS